MKFTTTLSASISPALQVRLNEFRPAPITVPTTVIEQAVRSSSSGWSLQKRLLSKERILKSNWYGEYQFDADKGLEIPFRDLTLVRQEEGWAIQAQPDCVESLWILLKDDLDFQPMPVGEAGIRVGEVRLPQWANSLSEEGYSHGSPLLLFLEEERAEVLASLQETLAESFRQ